jgi:nitroimidazol reductase NimA-like FMN-containing flavoprotein (pyridoxamine 5'-phosphate oxidase superfamily)
MDDERKQDIKRRVKEMLDSQPLAVLSTQNSGGPYANLVAFAVTGDLRLVLFATPRATRKYANIRADNRVAFLIDNRANDETDFHQATAVTALGRATEVPPPKRQEFENTYLSRHPYLAGFLHTPSTVFLQATIDSYVMVSHFQEVIELRMDNETNPAS